MTNTAVEKPYVPSKTEPFEALVLEHTCGSTKMGEEVVLAEAGQPFARMIHDTPEARDLALKIVTQLNDSAPRGSRPSRLQIKDRRERYDEQVARNAEHVAKTIELNMKLSQEKWEMVNHLWTHRTADQQQRDKMGQQAVRWAAELYAVRSFVTGVIRGRLYQEAEGHIDSQVAKWEEQWDTAFGDLVGKVLNMQE